MPINDIRKTVIQTINEVRRKLNVDTIATVSADSLGIAMLQYLNDTVAFISDQGDWLEQIDRVLVTAQSSVATYSIYSGASAPVVKNIYDFYFDSRNPMKNVGYSQIRTNSIMASATGQPFQYALVDTDSNGNPQFQVYPVPGASQDGQTFNITVFVKPPLYTGDDIDVVIPFDSRLTTKGLLALALLDESTGAPTNHYQVLAETFADENMQVYSRFRGNTGNEFSLIPARQRPRRR